MIAAAARWARSARAALVLAAVPVAAADSARRLQREVDDVVVIYLPRQLFAVGAWSAYLPQIDGSCSTTLRCVKRPR